MNVDRLVREVERRLEALPEDQRALVADAIREEIARERRRLDVGLTVEAERERRVEAETLREILEAINRQGRLEDTIEEVLKQLGRLVALDSCSLALLEQAGGFRIIAARGFTEPSKVVGATFQDALSDAVREGVPVSLADAREDERFARIEGTEEIRSWAGIPLLVEGEVLGVLCLDRHRVEPFGEEDLHRARAVAFSAAAAIRKAQLHEQVRRYAALMEHVVAVDHAAFAGQGASRVAATILEGALELGQYPGGLILSSATAPSVLAARGTLSGVEGSQAPPELSATEATRLDPHRAPALGAAMGADWAPQSLYLIPLATPEEHVGTLVLSDTDGETPSDRLLEAYASRAATAYLHAARPVR